MFFDHFLEPLTSHQQHLIIMAHDTLLQYLPEVRFSMKWGVPFYEYLGNLCYLNKHQASIYIGFYRGQELPHQPLLIKKDLKLVAKYYIHSTADLTNDAFNLILFDAVMLNERRNQK